VSVIFPIAWLLLHLPPLVAVSFLRGLCCFFFLVVMVGLNRSITCLD
jgi:hypothetical protein